MTFAGNGKCVQCFSNSDCPATQPICDPEELRCKAGCTSDAQCTGSQTPHCNLQASECVQCLTAADCSATPATPACDSHGRCAVCATNADCANKAGTPFCTTDREVAQCVACLRDQDCPTATPKCKDFACEAH